MLLAACFRACVDWAHLGRAILDDWKYFNDVVRATLRGDCLELAAKHFVQISVLVGVLKILECSKQFESQLNKTFYSSFLSCVKSREALRGLRMALQNFEWLLFCEPCSSQHFADYYNQFHGAEYPGSHNLFVLLNFLAWHSGVYGSKTRSSVYHGNLTQASLYSMTRQMLLGVAPQLNLMTPLEFLSATYGALPLVFDKLHAQQIFKLHGIPCLTTICYALNGVLVWERELQPGAIFQKPAYGVQGIGGVIAYRRYVVDENLHIQLDAHTHLTKREFELELSRLSCKAPYCAVLITEAERNCDEIANLGTSSRALKTCRIHTSCAGDDIFHSDVVQLKVPTKDIDVDNVKQGSDIFCYPIGKGARRSIKLHMHPNVGASQFSCVAATACSAHRVLAQKMSFVPNTTAWDIALTPKGPVIIEIEPYFETDAAERILNCPEMLQCITKGVSHTNCRMRIYNLTCKGK
mmetsp:Transcript_24642/g.84276  ORF Transcript_24642/g.84276 Transcript_24642/m.84276 type:complete len:466 (+) Transcript_24642:125-1522(+)